VTPAKAEAILRKLNPKCYRYRDDKKYNKKIEEIRKTHEKFYNNVVLTSVFMNVFSFNPDEFYLLLTRKVIENYRFDESWENPEWVWESIDEMCHDIAFGSKYFTCKSNGLFISLDITTKKNAMNLDDIIMVFSNYMGEPWSI
jgi:hypothetical protein